MTAPLKVKFDIILQLFFFIVNKSLEKFGDLGYNRRRHSFLEILMCKSNDRSGHEGVLRFFEEISKIPRRSYVTAPIAEYLCDFAKARGLACIRDRSDNVIIRKAASRGCENAPPVILQAHTDMVLVTSDEKQESPASEGLMLYTDGDYLRAKGTSLGGDDGIGVAYILAILNDGALTHPPIEAVFTSNEEVGLLGASALDLTMLSGRTLINLDSDSEGIFTAGCAGGSDATLSLPIERPLSLPCYTLTLKDLPGGHSGVNITDGIPNAILLALKMLLSLAGCHPVFLSDIHGGEAYNAIPSFASIRFCCEAEFDKIEGFCKDIFTNSSESGSCGIKKEEGAFPCMRCEESLRMIEALLSLPNGVQAMERDLAGIPETSLSLGVIRTEGDSLSLGYAIRSSVNEKREALESALIHRAEALGGRACIGGVYPAWAYRERSPLREKCLDAYRALCGKEARVDVIHAGLECGIFASGLEGLDAVSFGPTNIAIHTAEERLSLSSCARTYKLLLKILAALADCVLRADRKEINNYEQGKT